VIFGKKNGFGTLEVKWLGGFGNWYSIICLELKTSWMVKSLKMLGIVYKYQMEVYKARKLT